MDFATDVIQFAENELYDDFYKIIVDPILDDNTKCFSYDIIKCQNYPLKFEALWKFFSEREKLNPNPLTRTYVIKEDHYIMLKLLISDIRETVIFFEPQLIKILTESYKQYALINDAIERGMKMIDQEVDKRIHNNSFELRHGPYTQTLFEWILLPEINQPTLINVINNASIDKFCEHFNCKHSNDPKNKVLYSPRYNEDWINGKENQLTGHINTYQDSRVKKSLPLQKKYSLIQETGRKMRSETDSMFINSNHTKRERHANAYYKIFNDKVRKFPLQREEKTSERVQKSTKTNLQSKNTLIKLGNTSEMLSHRYETSFSIKQAANIKFDTNNTAEPTKNIVSAGQVDLTKQIDEILVRHNIESIQEMFKIENSIVYNEAPKIYDPVIKDNNKLNAINRIYKRDLSKTTSVARRKLIFD